MIYSKLGCPLCGSEKSSEQIIRNKTFYYCSECKSVRLSSEHFLTEEAEQARYLTHNNDVNDPRYQRFVQPIVDIILQSHDTSQVGLDFGAGTGPVITKMLKDKGFTSEIYDPFFHPSGELLNQKYDFIIACEVIEHFYYPSKEFNLLRKLLKEGGVLYCKTNLLTNTIDFKSWWYKNDETHVFFYRPETMAYIAKTFGFSSYEIRPEVIVLKA